MKYLIILIYAFFLSVACVKGQHAPVSATGMDTAIIVGFDDPRAKSFSANIWLNGKSEGSIKARQWTRLLIGPGEVVVELRFSKWSSHKNQKIKVQAILGQESYVVYAAEPASLGQMPLAGGGFVTIGTTHGKIFEVTSVGGKKLFDTFEYVPQNAAKKES